MTHYTLDNLLEEYIYQRHQQVTSERAIEFLYELHPGLVESEQQQLASSIREWELNNQQFLTGGGAQIKRSVPVPAHRREGVPIVNGLICNHCSTVNPAGSKYCYSCGQLLEAGSSTNASDTTALPDEDEDPALFGSMASLVIIVRGYESNPLHIDVGLTTLLIGRDDEATSFHADIDLSPFGASGSGVSRRHALLKREAQTLTLIDQGSINHTYINGEKLHPHEVRVLRDGDELRFGKLVTKVTFQRELRRLS